MWFEKIFPSRFARRSLAVLKGLDYALALLSVTEGVRAVEVGENQAINVYVRSVDELYPIVSAVMRRHAPNIHGQVRGPSYPVAPPEPPVCVVAQ